MRFNLTPRMRKYDFLQLAVILIGFWASYQACLFFFYLLINILNAITAVDLYPGIFAYVISDFVLMTGHFIIAYVALKKTDIILKRLQVSDRNTGIDIPPPKEVLYIVVIGVGLLLFAQAVPEFLDAVFGAFRARIKPGSSYPEPTQVAVPLLKVVLPFLLLVFARKITRFFYKESPSVS